MQFPEGLENTPFTIKMTVLALEQLLKGVFVIIAPSKMSVGTSEDYILAYCKILFVSYSFICFHYMKHYIYEMKNHTFLI